jgi:DNA-binding transcriptional ArsR family regulator
MSARAITWAWEQSAASSGEKLVLIALADRADEDGHCWPSAEWLGTKTGLNERSVRRHLDSLEKRGLLARVRRHRADGTLGVYDYYLSVEIMVGTTGHPRPVDHRTPAPGSPPDTGARAETTIPKTSKGTTDVVPAAPADFDKFWEAYGRKVGKKAACGQWDRHVRGKVDPEMVIAAAAAYAAVTPVKYRKHPERWLRDHRWADEDCGTGTAGNSDQWAVWDRIQDEVDGVAQPPATLRLIEGSGDDER